MIVQIVLPRSESEAFSGGDVIGEIIEVEGLTGNEVVGRDGFLVEVIVRFDCANFLREVMVVKEAEAGVGG